MKKITTLISFILMASLFAFNVSAQGVHWETGTLQEALNIAKTNKRGPKLVFIDCYTSWCGPCKYMTNTIFPSKEAADYFNKNFVNIKFDMEKGEGVGIAKRYDVGVYPTFLILDAEGKEVGRVLGSDETVIKFINRVDSAKDPTNSLSVLLEKFNKSHDLSDGLNYLNKSEDLYMNKNIKDFFSQDLSFIRDYDKYSLRVWYFADKAISFEQPRFLNEIIDNRETIYQYLDKSLVDETIIRGISSQLVLYMFNCVEVTPELLNRSVSTIKSVCIVKNDSYAFLLADVAKAYSEKDAVKINQLLELPRILYKDYSLSKLVVFYQIYMNCDFIPQQDKDRYKERYKKSIDERYKRSVVKIAAVEE